MQANIHPFEKYPFDVKRLPAAISREVAHFDFYTTSRAIEKAIVTDNLSDANTLLCWAYFVWIDAMALQTGAEILSSGESALKIIAGILEKESGHKPSLKLQKFINDEIKKVHKANKWYDKFHCFGRSLTGPVLRILRFIPIIFPTPSSIYCWRLQTNGMNLNLSG